MVAGIFQFWRPGCIPSLAAGAGRWCPQPKFCLLASFLGRKQNVPAPGQNLPAPWRNCLFVILLHCGLIFRSHGKLCLWPQDQKILPNSPQPKKKVIRATVVYLLYHYSPPHAKYISARFPSILNFAVQESQMPFFLRHKYPQALKMTRPIRTSPTTLHLQLI